MLDTQILVIGSGTPYTHDGGSALCEMLEQPSYKDWEDELKQEGSAGDISYAVVPVLCALRNAAGTQSGLHNHANRYSVNSLKIIQALR